MPILGYPAHPEHDQVAPAAVVFGVSDPDDTRVRIPRRLLVDIVAVVVDALDVDTDQVALVDYLAERFADRVVLVRDDFPTFAELVPGPILVDVDPVTGRDYAEEAWQRAELEREGLAELAEEARLATAQRAEWHVDVSDDVLAELAMHRSGVSL